MPVPNADWMWKIMEEATEELRKRPAWEVEMLRNAPRMYPSLRQEGDDEMPKKPTEITISNDKHTFTLRVGDKVFVTSRRYDPFNTDAVKAPDYLSVAEVFDIRGGKTPTVRVGGSSYDSKGECVGYGRERLEPYDADREVRHRAEDLNHTQMSRASSALASVQRGQWQVICNDPTRRAAIIALLGDDVPALKETTR